MLPLPVQQITDWWLPRMEAVVAENLVSVLFTGSVVLDDYCDGWSDIDVCIVLRNEVTRASAPELCALHDSMRDTFERRYDWRSNQFIEGYYVSLNLVTRQKHEDWCYVAGGTTRKHYYGNPITPFDRYVLSCHSILLAGREIEFAPPATGELAMQTRKDLETLTNYAGQSGLWLCSMLHWLARTIVYWRDGFLLSKSAALCREIERGSAFHKAYQLALKARQEGSSNAERYQDELLPLYAEVVPRAQQEIAEYLNNATVR